MSLIIFLILIKVQLLYNGVLASTVQSSESAIQIHTYYVCARSCPTLCSPVLL